MILLLSFCCSSDSHKLGFTFQRFVHVSQTHWLKCTDLTGQLPDAAAEEVQCRPALGLWASPGTMGSGQQCLAAGLHGHEMHVGPLAGPLVTLFTVRTDCSICSWQLNISFCTNWLRAAAKRSQRVGRNCYFFPDGKWKYRRENMNMMQWTTK